MKKSFNWRLAASVGTLALLSGLISPSAHALGLGRVSVQSALGEPLRAEIDIPEINANEAASLTASVAPAEVFRIAGLEYSAFVSDLQISLQKRPNGRSFLKLSSARVVTEPFVDLVLEASWSTGRISRDYTMLFDPPNLRQPSGAAALAAPLLTRPVAPLSQAPGRANALPPAQTTTRPAPADKPPLATKAAQPAPLAEDTGKFSVKAGDTAGKIAAQVKPASVSLDQMLLALLRANPDAFIGSNINRLKSGSILDIPSADAASAIAPGEASTAISAQAKNFNDFRRKLAENAPVTQTDSANRQASGKLQAKVEDKAPIAATPDKLTLSKGAIQGKAAAEDKIAKERQAKEASERAVELAKNIGDLNKLSGAPAPATGTLATAGTGKSTSTTAAKPDTPPVLTAAASASAPTLASASLPTLAVTATVLPATNTASAFETAMPASAPALVASEPSALMPQEPASSVAVVAPPKKTPVVATTPPPEPSFLDGLTDNPLVVPGLAGFALLLGGLGFYRYRKRSSAAQLDSSFLESRLQPDSFFGASGGQRIDTNEGGATGSSLVYSPSQLDVAGDVDPVAEADVYLAYGRDLQAEEILKEAMRTSPNRVAVHAKLMEIYAKRRDTVGFKDVAAQAFSLTGGEGPEWAYISEMGRELDPSNPLYQSDSEPEERPAPASNAVPQYKPVPMQKTAPAPVVDLDFDFSTTDELTAATPAPIQALQPSAASSKPAPASLLTGLDMSSLDMNSLDMDFSADTTVTALTANAPVTKPVSTPTPSPQADDNAFSANGLTFTNEPFEPVKPSAAPVVAVMNSGMLEFDMSSLSLDLGESTAAAPAAAVKTDTPTGNDPLELTFSLAEEFRALGDMENARAFAQEVAEQATGSLKNKAQAFMNALS